MISQIFSMCLKQEQDSFLIFPSLILLIKTVKIHSSKSLKISNWTPINNLLKITLLFCYQPPKKAEMSDHPLKCKEYFVNSPSSEDIL